MCFLLGCSNWILAGKCLYESLGSSPNNIPKNYRAVEMNSSLIAEMEINKIYEKKYEFIDVFVNLFDESDETCVMSINLIAIYKLEVLNGTYNIHINP